MPIVEPIVHIFPQSHQHDDASIVGNHEGLRRLRDAINLLLQEQVNRPEEILASSSPAMIACDGEGYVIQVIKIEGDSEAMKSVAMPYTDESARESRDTAKYPYELIGSNLYRSLHEQAWAQD